MYRGTLVSGFVNISVYFNIQPVLAIHANQIRLSRNRVSLKKFTIFLVILLNQFIVEGYLNTHSFLMF